MPPRPRKTTPRKTTAARASRTHTDKLQAEAAQRKLPAAARVHTWHELNRRQRAEVMSGVQSLLPRVANVEKAISATGDLTQDNMAAAADTLVLLADLEDLLAGIALDRVKFLDWSQKSDEMDLLAAFMQFVDGLGEANGSSR